MHVKYDAGVDLFSASGGTVQDKTLFVKHLPSSITKEELREYFDGLTKICLPTKDDGTIKGLVIRCH